MESDIYQQWAKVAPREALAHLLSQPDEGKNTQAVEAVFGMVYRSDPLAANMELEKSNGMIRYAAIQGIYGLMGIHHPEEALKEAAALKTRAGDEMDAMAWGSVAYNAAIRLVKRNPRQAMELAAKVSETAAGEGALKAAAERWAEKDAAAAETWLRENKSAGRNEVLSRLLWKRLDNDLERIAGEFPSLIAGSKIGNETISFSAALVKKQMESGSMEAVAEWTTRLPEGPIRDISQMLVAEKWVETDTLQASEWIRQMPPGPRRDAPTEKLIQAIQDSDPASAVEWAKVISQPEMKQKALDGIFENWRKTDPDAAAARAGFGSE